MTASPVKFLFGFLFASIILWLIFIFSARLVAWILSRVLRASVEFRVGGWKCLRDVVVRFKKGAVESVSVGEIRISLRQSLVKLGVGFISKDPKLQVLICDLEVVMRTSPKSTPKAKSAKPQKARNPGKGKWMVVANMARFLSVSVTDLILKTSKATTEIKGLRVDISKDGGSKPTLVVKLNLLPVVVLVGEPRVSCDQSSICNSAECIKAQSSMPLMEKTSAPFSCDEFSLLCEFGYDSDVGIVIKNVEMTTGEVSVNLSEDFLLKNKKLSEKEDATGTPANTETAKKLQKKQQSLASISKYTSMIPEKVYFNLPKLDVRFLHREHDLLLENNITGVQLKSIKSRSSEDIGDSNRLDIQLDFSEIHLLRESGTSLLGIQKVDVVSFVYVPLQLALPIRVEMDVKLGGTQCNIMMSRLQSWMRLKMSKKKKMVLLEETSHKKPQSSEPKLIMWTCTVSAPEMTVALHDFNGLPLYQACSQSSHVFANNISKNGPAVHLELGELNLHLADEYQECMKESLFGVETNLGALMHIAKVTLDWGKRDIEVRDEDGPRIILALSIDVTGMGVYLTFKRVESIVSTASSVKAFLKSISASTNKTQYRGGRLSKPSGKGIRLLKFNLERCSVSFSGDAGVENTVVMDPKHFNYGSQGGKVVIRQSAHGTPRTADIISTISDESKRLKYTMSLDIFHLNLSMNKDKQSTHLELERARAIHQEYSVDQRPVTKVVLFDMQNAKFVRHSGGLKEIAACSLFSATDITVRWEPDVHISLFELMLQLKLAVHNRKLQGLGNEHLEETFSKTDIDQNKEGNLEPGVSNKRQKKKESIFAVDVEMLNITAEAGDGVDVVVQVQSIFSENARIGVLLEGLILDINGCRLFRSSRMQISRIPHTSSSSDGRQSTSIATVWDWVIQGIDVHICMPYRLQLRAIDDSVEEMLRALRLITSAKTKILFPMKTESSKPKKPSSTKLGCVRFCMRKLTADIEEEPIQGWLDEHYQLLKNEACELAVRSKFLDEKVCLGNECLEAAETKDSINENKVHHNGIEINMKDSSAFSKPQEEMYKMSFRSYYEACQKLSVSEGSGACRTGFQSGFKASSARTSLLSISATDLDLSLTPIEGEDDGIIEILKRLDPVCLEKNIPFSKLYGCNILLNTVSSLAVQLRNYTYPLFSATSGTCQGRLILAQQATCFQPQVQRDVFIGKWRKVRILRSAMGTTPPMKTYFDLPLSFQKAEVGFGVGFEPAFADISYAFTVALRRANLSVREPGILATPSKKEKSLPWWDDMRNYIHGNITLQFNETIWHILATTDPYEKLDKLTITSSFMELQQSDSQVYVSMKDFKIVLSSLESLVNRQSLKIPIDRSCAFLEAPSFTLDVSMEWGCASGSPMNHYLFALPVEGKSREIVFDPFRSTSLSLRFDFSLRPTFHSCDESTSSTAGDNSLLEQNVNATPTFHMAAHDVAWLTKFWNLNYLPPHKLRTFSRWARFGVPRVARSGNLSLDRVLTEFMLRIDATPVCIRHLPLDSDDPAKGLTFKMTKLKVETCQSRGKQNFTFECKRETLDLVYQGIDLHMPKINLDKEENKSTPVYIQMARASQSGSTDRLSCDKGNNISGCTERHRDDGFFLSSDYFTIRRQAPKADAARLLAWQEAGRRNLEMTYVRSEFENASDSDEHTRSEPSDDDGYNVVIADNCQRVFVYGLKLLWTIENRNAVWSFVGGISKAFRPPVPSPSRQYAQRRLHESQKLDGDEKNKKSVPVTLSSSQGANSSSPHEVGSAGSQSSTSSSIAMVSTSSTSNSVGVASTSSALAAKNGDMGDHEEGTLHFMVNVIEPQFNLHSEDANGRFLLAANSGRVLARSFHSVLQVGVEVIEQLGTGAVHIPESRPEMMWKRMELSVMLKQVQAHVAPTDVDPGAGLQWLPKMSRSSPKVNRTGALLERVFMPCDMYFRYTRHKGGTADLKVKPLKELTFNSQNIIATMTSRQFQVMLDVLTNLLFARLPKPRKSSLSYPTDDDEDVEEEADEVVPDGVEEVELARVTLEQKEREQRLLLADIRKLSVSSGPSSDLNPDKEGDLWMIAGGRSTLVCALKKKLLNAKKIRKEASAQLRTSLQKAAQLRLMEKEKNKAPSYAMRISLQIKKVVWAMLVDGKPFAESEINDMRYDFDRDYKDVGVVQFMTKSFVVRNCLPNAKSDMLLSAWNPPADWGKKMMLCVDAKQGAPKDGHSPLELFQVEIYPLKIHLTETMYRTMWEYFFPEEEQDSQRRQEVWKVSTTAGLKRVKKGSLVNETVASSSHATKESEVSKPSTGTSIVSSSLFTSLTTHHADGAQASKAQNLKENLISGSTPELRRTSSFDRTWEENVAESVANELVLQVHSSSKCGPLSSAEQQDDPSKNKLKDSKPVKSGRSSHEEKKTVKAQDEKRSRPRRLMEFHNIKISQVELLVTYEGSRFVVNELKLLMDTFHRPEFTGTWRRLFSRVKKHIIWGVLKSVTGMQGKKFKDKVRNQRELGGSGVPDSDLNFSDNEGQTEKLDQNPIHFLKRPSDGAGDGFVTSVKGLFNTQRRKAKKFVLRTMRGDGENDVHGEWTVSDVESSPLARQLTMTKAKRLIRRHTKKFRSRQKGSSSQQRESLPNSPRETTAFESDSLLGSDPYEDFPEFHRPL